ncbi:MAG: hypothetical protein M1816_000816 [Peltula sp. TS41687]|nr:MAG: hypothetical protein M1816_000816 [Peltula sp. TS41687]
MAKGSRPEIFKSLSKQSIAATDEYQSCGDYATDGSSLEDPATVRWSTPPSQPRSTQATPEILQISPSPTSRRVWVDSTTTSPAIIEATEARGTQCQLSPVIPVAATEADLSPPTPGVDDTPYIHYAIEQITRDASEPRSRRLPTVANNSTCPVERIVPAVNLVPPPPPPKPVGPSRPSSGAPFISQRDSQTLIPIDPPRNSSRYPQLTFLPAILRLPSLIFLIFLCLLMIAGLLFCAIRSRRHSGLWDYTDFRGGRYFLFGFLPQILASLIVLYVLSVKLTLMRLMPFISMASDSVKLRSNALLLSMRPTSLILPQVGYYKRSHPIIASCLVIFWLSVFTIPLQSSLFQVRWFQTRWRWVTAEGVAWTLVALYIIITLALMMLASFLFRRRTGLKWDPTSLADLIVLLQQSNSLQDYEGAETFRFRREFRDRLNLRSERLGYWRTRESRAGIFYAIGEEGAPTRRYSLQQGKIKKYPLGGEVDSRVDLDLESQQSQGHGSTGRLSARIRSPLVRYRFIPWYLRDTYLFAWIAIAILLLIAFVVVSFVHHAVRQGFLPRLDAPPNGAGFSPPGFLYSFLPSLIGLALFLSWYTIDINFRALQPFADLSDPSGAPAEKSLLLDYTSCLLIEVSAKAVAAGHWKVAWISFVTLLSIILPILGGGVFWAIYFPQEREVRMVAQMPAFGALVAFLVIYALSFLFIWPRRMRYLPHDTRTLAEFTSFLYQSPLLRDRSFYEPLSKTDLVTRLVSLASEEKESRRYYFGIYHGLDRKDHLGIDWFQRHQSEVPRADKSEKR